MDAGAYREKVTIERVIATEKDKAGNQVQKWEPYFRTNAYVNNLSGREYWAAFQAREEDTVQFIFRYHRILEEIDTTHFRIEWKKHKYDIIFIDNVKYRNETIKIKTKVKK